MSDTRMIRLALVDVRSTWRAKSGDGEQKDSVSMLAETEKQAEELAAARVTRKPELQSRLVRMDCKFREWLT